MYYIIYIYNMYYIYSVEKFLEGILGYDKDWTDWTTVGLIGLTVFSI